MYKSHNMENASESVEENIPKILSPELHDVFPFFANMLDIKSFMKLAMTSKNMYKRCMEDKAIKINVEESYFKVYNNDGVPGFLIQSSLVSASHLVNYLTTLRKQQFNLSLCKVGIHINAEADESMLDATREYLNKFGVKRIKKLVISEGFTEWKAIIPFIEEFGVSSLKIFKQFIPLPIFRSILEMELEMFSFSGSIPIDFLLEVDSPIRILKFHGRRRRIGRDKFMQILWKIQTGSLKHLFLYSESVDWSLYDTLPFDYEGPLPDDRPLIFARTDDFQGGEEYVFLHWQEGVTKCVRYGCHGYLTVFKCPPIDFPPILRKDQDVMNDLSNKLPESACYGSQFSRFTECFTLLDSSFNGPLPSERPFYFKATQSFWELDENENLMECAWNNTKATWKSLNETDTYQVGNRSLAKLLFRKHLQEPTNESDTFHCNGPDELDFWLDGFTKVDFECSAPLPKERPLVFENTPLRGNTEKIYVVFGEGGLSQCELFGSVRVRPCMPWNVPPVLFDANDVKEILMLNPYFEIRQGLNIRMDLEMFHAGFELFKTSPFDEEHPQRRPIVFETIPDQKSDDKLAERHWFSVDGHILEVLWKNGLFMLLKPDPYEIPFEFMKQLIQHFVETVDIDVDSFFMNLEQFHGCLEQFERVPFDYAGPLSRNSPLAFVESEIHHICVNGATRRPRCKCPEGLYRVWFLLDGVNVKFCSWGEKEPRQVLFCRHTQDLPPALKSKEYLRNLLEMFSEDSGWIYWYGNLPDFHACFEDYTKISPDHKGPLPEERPLLVERDTEEEFKRYLLRDDGRIIECVWHSNHASVETAHPFSTDIPTVLKPLL